MAKLQGRYVDLERKAVVLTQLGKSQAEVNGARKNGAAKQAPMMLKKAELSLKTAESVISTNVRNPQGFAVAVAEANSDAKMLMDVMETIKQSGTALPEASAVRIVQQNRQIANLKTDKAVTARQTASAAESLGEKTDLLSAANAKVEIQRIMEQARQQFKPDEAEAFQQGGKLLIRMKNVNFASGRAELPGSSLAGLAKVSEIAKALNASEIQVEGHTDSTGNDEQNKTISEQRAGAVASYFQSNGFGDIKVQSVGYGFSKPVTTNKSKAGRALNRRVDIIITPQAGDSTRN